MTLIKKINVDRHKENIIFLLALTAVFLLSFKNYLLFHSIIEIMSIVIGALIFIIIVNAQDWIDNTFLKFLGVSYFFVSILGLLHAFSYSGLNVFVGYGADLPTKLWIMGRYLLSLSLLVALLIHKKKIKFGSIVIGYSILSAIIIYFIFKGGFIPTTFVPGQGLTDFKIYSEYLICLFLFGALVLLFRLRHDFENHVFRYLNYSLLASILTELVFTLYLSVFDIFNVLGHVFNLLAFFFIYRAVVEEGIQRPQRLLYRNLKQNEERLMVSEKNLSDLFRNMNSGFALHKIVCNEAGQAIDYIFLEVNQAFEKLTGLKAQDIIGQAVTKVIPGIGSGKADWIGTYGRVALDGQGQRFEQYAEDLNRWYSVSAYQARPGYFATVFEDISERKEMEKIKNEFVYFVSHELKNPLSSIRLCLDLMFRGAVGNIEEKQKEFLKSIEGSVYNMQDFIESLLNLSKVESSSVFGNLEPADINIQLRTLLEELDAQIKEKEIRLKLEMAKGLPIIMIDEKVFGLIFRNLLSNAIRYSYQGGEIIVKTFAKDDILIVAVSDFGRGIPLEDQGRIFEKLFRANNANQEGTKGSGLGLYIAKSMADKICANLRFVSEPGVGTTFYVEFPLRKFRVDD